MSVLRVTRDHLVAADQRPYVEAYARQLYRPLAKQVGWNPAPGEPGERKLMRRGVIHFLAFTARDAEVRREALRRGRKYLGLDGQAPDPAVVDPELVDLALAVTVQEAGAEAFDAMLARLSASDDGVERARLLGSLGAARDPDLAHRARLLALDPQLKVSEVFATLWPQSNEVEMREAIWGFVRDHYDALVERAGSTRAGSLPWMAASFCDETSAARVERFFSGRIEKLDGGPRNLAGVLERIRLCAGLAEHHGETARAFFAGRSRD